MVRKIILLLLITLPAFGATELTLKEGNRVAKLKQVKNYWLSSNCKKCEAQKIFDGLNAKRAKEAMNKTADTRIAPGTRICNGLNGMVWALKDENGQTQTICEFKDKSYVLTNDLAGLLP
jgi:hypothetical protein